MGGGRNEIATLEEFKGRVLERMAACGMRFDRDVARSSGINESTYANLWKGDRKGLPYADHAVAIARALDTTVEYLVTGEGPQLVKPMDPDLMEICQLLQGVPTEKVKAMLVLLRKEPGLGRGQRGSTEEVAG